MESTQKMREQENAKALGGMRNPHIAVSRLPGMTDRGEVVRSFLVKAQELWPDLRGPATAILSGEEPDPELPVLLK